MWKETWPDAERRQCPACGAGIMKDAVAKGKAKLHGHHHIDYPIRIDCEQKDGIDNG